MQSLSSLTELVTAQKWINYSEHPVPHGRQKPGGSSLLWEGAEAHGVTCISSCAQELQNEPLCVLGQCKDSHLQLDPGITVEEALTSVGTRATPPAASMRWKTSTSVILWGSSGPGLELHLKFKMLALRGGPFLSWTLCNSHEQLQLCLRYGW